MLNYQLQVSLHLHHNATGWTGGYLLPVPTNGYVYQDGVGTSQDGNPIEAWCRLPFNNERSPRYRKRWRRAVFDMTVDTYSMLNIGYDLGYGNPMVQPSAPGSPTVH